MKIVCDNKIPFLKGALEPYAQVVYLPGKDTTPDVVRDADAIITRTRTICNEELLKGSSVKIIATATIGFDHIDTAWCEGNGIAWTNAPGCNSWSVQQYIASLLVSLSRTYGFDPKEKTVGVIGVGNVGSKVARIAALLGFKVVLNDPPRQRREGLKDFVSLDTLIEESDIITCHVPLQRDGEDCTWHLFDETRLASLRKDQILINSSRGEVVDNQALKKALQDRKILAASLDVWENEPAIDTELLDLLYTGTPHIAGYSLDGKANGTTMSVQAVARFLDLPCRDWEVTEIPLPAQPVEFSLDCTGKTARQVLAEAIMYTYDIKSDDARLRSDIGLFEKQRADYPVRREFPAFTVKLENDVTGSATVFLREAGFRIAGDQETA
ncbi:MAG: 4-phosphoerythronate dehydrogenase PdxB [Bacteroidetes bacterium]|nr:4-phosphoerythronate dehydrogenase PdxB [Candidatus Colenecus caballi]